MCTQKCCQGRTCTCAKPHKHRDLIVAWANGAKIQVLSMMNGKWTDILDDYIIWREDAEYRIKPEPKPDVVKEEFLYKLVTSGFVPVGIFRRVEDGETGQLKSAEVLP